VIIARESKLRIASLHRLIKLDAIAEELIDATRREGADKADQ
jgi:hypothetical protein